MEFRYFACRLFVAVTVRRLCPGPYVSDDKSWTVLNWKILLTTISDVVRMGRKFIDTIQEKTVWEKDILLVTSNFSFSHNVFYTSLRFELWLISMINSSSLCYGLTKFQCRCMAMAYPYGNTESAYRSIRPSFYSFFYLFDLDLCNYWTSFI